MSNRYTKATLGGRIYYALKASGVSKSDLMRETGRSRETINRWIRDDATPSSASLETIAELTGSSVKYLVSGEGEMFDSRERVKSKDLQTSGRPPHRLVIHARDEDSSGDLILSLTQLIEPLIKRRLMEVTTLRASDSFRQGFGFTFRLSLTAKITK